MIDKEDNKALKEYFQASIFSTKYNTILSVLLSVYLLFASLGIFSDGNLAWSLYGLSIVVLVFIPPLVLKDVDALAPFEVLLFLAVPFTLKGLELGFVASHTLSYLSAAGIAILIVSELDTYTSFKTTPGFSTILVTITTIAVAGFWAVGRWISDIYLGTALITSEHDLMWEFASASLAGVLAGKIFSYYFSLRDKRLERS